MRDCNAGHAGCTSHCRRQLDRSLNYFPRPRALLMAAKRLYLSSPPTPRVILEGRRRNPRIRLTRSVFTASWDRILPYNGVLRRMLNGPAHNGMDAHVPMRLTYDFVLCGRDLPERRDLSSVYPALHPRCPFYVLRRAAFAGAANSLLLYACSRARSRFYSRYARKLLRNVVLGRKFAVAVIEPPYRAQLSTANPGLLRYTFESDFPRMSSATRRAMLTSARC